MSGTHVFSVRVSCFALCQVLIFNPGFPWYLSTARMVGATPVLVELAGPDFAPDLDKVCPCLSCLVTFLVLAVVVEASLIGRVRVHWPVVVSMGANRRTVWT